MSGDAATRRCRDRSGSSLTVSEWGRAARLERRCIHGHGVASFVL